MGYAHAGRTLGKVGVIGSGQIGPDIALHLAKVLAPHGVEVVVVDISEDALARGRAKLEGKVEKGVVAKAFKPAAAQELLAALRFTSDYDALAGAGLVVEAATEDERVKGKIMAQVAARCPADALLLSNSSHLEPERIFAGVPHPGRCAVAHYFFPAERNPVVEVVPGAATAPETTAWLLSFYEAIGKLPVRVGSRYGYAVDPVFEGLLQTSALLVERGVATVPQVDAVAQRALGLGVGPFTAHNLTGGNPITAHGLAELHGRVCAWYSPPASLRAHAAAGTAWPVARKGEAVEVPPAVERAVSDALRATYFGLVGEVLDAGIVDPSDYELALEQGLVLEPPLRAMNALGPGAALALVRRFAAEHPGFPVPRCLVERGEADRPWEVEHVRRADRDGVAVLTIRRPKVLNALDADVFAQLERHLAAIEADPAVCAAVVTGWGTKAFVSGADVGMLAKVASAAEGEAMSRGSQRPLDRLAACTKPVVAALNGLAFGGGLELALACQERLVVPDALLGQPEVNLGILPGAGGTQRLPRLIGVEAAARLLRTGKPVDAAEALALGLVDVVVPREELLVRACFRARELARGAPPARRLPAAPLEGVPEALPPLELGHLSRAIDALVCRAILEGARGTLADGLALEARLFGACAETKDMRLGLDTFLREGPRAKAAFVHA